MSRLSAVFIGLQFALVILIVWPFRPQHFSAIFWVVMLASIALGIYTLLHNRLGNFNIRPEPKAGTAFITSGPYRYIRHPMYSTLLLATAAFVFAENIWVKLGLWIALALVLSAKASFEEQLMSEKFSDYAAYLARSKRFVPLIF